MQKPLLQMRKAVRIWLCSYLITLLVLRLAYDTSPTIGALTLWVFFLGHTVLAAIVLRRCQLRLRFPIDASWIDVLVVAGAPWLGPILWYREWKK